jgi:hypothetical protein
VRVRLRGTRAGEADAEQGFAPVASRPGPAPAAGGRRAWNLWELDRLAREMDGDDRAEERRLLLLHLRDFADASGQLPAEFDPLVREAFETRLAELA